MADNFYKSTDTELLPVRQRLAWMAAVWAVSAGAMVLVTLAVHRLVT